MHNSAKVNKTNEKLETLKLLDSEIVELTPEEGLEDEIEQADGYKENVYRALTMIDKVYRNPHPVPLHPLLIRMSMLRRQHMRLYLA